MYFRKKFAALTMAGAAASIMLAAAPASASVLASSQAAGPAISIPEIATGAIHGKPATAEFVSIPLSWQGLVATHSVFSPHGNPPGEGTDTTFPTAAGKLVLLVTAAPREGQTFNMKTCYFTYRTIVNFTTVPGKSTGKFAGAAGPGAVRVFWGGYVPRYTSGSKKGQCNTSPSAPELTKGAVSTFVLGAELTTT